jgi:hypothetical protein
VGTGLSVAKPITCDNASPATMPATERTREIELRTTPSTSDDGIGVGISNCGAGEVPAFPRSYTNCPTLRLFHSRNAGS